jgi:hypothetical protein
MARLSPAELYENHYPDASPFAKPWHKVTYVTTKDNFALSDYVTAVVSEVNALANAKQLVNNDLQYLVGVTQMPQRAHKNKLRKLLRKYTCLTKNLEDIEYTLQSHTRHTGHYINNTDPNKGLPGVFFVTKHGSKDNDLIKYSSTKLLF